MGTTLRVAEKLHSDGRSYQGTTSVVPQLLQNQCGLQPLRYAFLTAPKISPFFRNLFSRASGGK
jgi:hypothetical protein